MDLDRIPQTDKIRNTFFKYFINMNGKLLIAVNLLIMHYRFKKLLLLKRLNIIYLYSTAIL